MDTLVVLKRSIKKPTPALNQPTPPLGRLPNSESMPITQCLPKISFVKLYHDACKHNKKCGDARRRQLKSTSARDDDKRAVDRFGARGNMFSESTDSVLKAYLMQEQYETRASYTHKSTLTAEMLAEITYDEDELHY